MTEIIAWVSTLMWAVMTFKYITLAGKYRTLNAGNEALVNVADDLLSFKEEARRLDVKT